MGPKVNLTAEIAKIHSLITDIKADLATKATETKLEQLTAVLHEKDNKIEILESRIELLENVVEKWKGKCEENEQYSRRLTLRITNIPVANEGETETADDCLEKVKEVISETGADIPDEFIDRAHRIGKVFKREEDGHEQQAMIVKFTTWRHRTRLNRKRKTLKQSKIFLDLTKTRFKTLKSCQKKAEGNPKIEFVFADVNCSLCIKLQTGEFKYFSSEKHFDNIVKKLK